METGSNVGMSCGGQVRVAERTQGTDEKALEGAWAKLMGETLCHLHVII